MVVVCFVGEEFEGGFDFWGVVLAVDDGGVSFVVEARIVVATVTVAGPGFWGRADERRGRARRMSAERIVDEMMISDYAWCRNDVVFRR